MTVSMNLQKGLIGHYVSNASSIGNNILYDASGYGSHTTENTLTTDTGFMDTSVRGDGNTLYISSSKIKDAIENAEFTVSLWWKQDYDSTQNWVDLIQWKDDSSKQSTKRLERGYAESSTESDYWCNFGMNPDQRKGAISNSNLGFLEGEWFHIVVRVDSVNDLFTVFINNQIDGETSVDTTEIYRPNTDIRIKPHSSQSNFEDLRIYNRALPDSEIQQLYNMRNQRNYYV